VKEIQLTQGHVALVDDEDFERIAVHNWYATRYKNGRFYAVRNRPTVEGKRGTILMQREVLGLPIGRYPHVDHCDPNATLDNRKGNLRTADKTQNGANRGCQVNNKSGFKGVCSMATGKFRAQIKVHGKNMYLGCRDTAEAAHRELYIPAALKHFGDFARFQ
jgi:hypothetical protein